MTNEQERKYRINTCATAIKQATEKFGNCGKEKLIAQLGIQMGISRRTALEYISMLVGSEMVNETAGILKWQEK